MRVWIRSFFSSLILTICASVASASETVSITDIAGRTVDVNVPVKKMILGEGRFLPTLGILDREDPVRWVAGMMGEYKRYDPAGYTQYAERFPQLGDVPLIGRGSARSFSLERAITLSPDVAVFGLGSGHGPGARHKDILDRLKAAGIPVVVLDFRMDPIVNTAKSIKLLGRLMGREAEAAEFLSFYENQLSVVRERLKDVDRKPSVFMEIHVGLRSGCCTAMGRGMMGKFIDWAGGKNLVGTKIPGTHGTVNLEYLLVNQPDVYIGTAIGSVATAQKFPKRIVLGAGAPAKLARQSLRRAMARTGIQELKSVAQGRTHALWHHFYNTPMNVAAVQAMAKWLHPKKFSYLSPRRTLEEYFARFQPVSLNGVYWTSLKPPDEGQ